MGSDPRNSSRASSSQPPCARGRAIPDSVIARNLQGNQRLQYGSSGWGADGRRAARSKSPSSITPDAPSNGEHTLPPRSAAVTLVTSSGGRRDGQRRSFPDFPWALDRHAPNVATLFLE